MLEVRDLSFAYGKHHALSSVSLIVGRGEVVVILGANGAGKTTLLKTIVGLLPPAPGASRTLDGKSLDKWTHLAGKPVRWKVEGGAATVEPGSGNIATIEEFGDCQIHVEFRTPADVSGDSQGRGNSGVYIQGRYEVQVLDSYQNETYPEGMCGAIYGYHIPVVNACRKPGDFGLSHRKVSFLRDIEIGQGLG